MILREKEVVLSNSKKAELAPRLRQPSQLAK
jgi:hypothetical protein